MKGFYSEYVYRVGCEQVDSAIDCCLQGIIKVQGQIFVNPCQHSLIGDIILRLSLITLLLLVISAPLLDAAPVEMRIVAARTVYNTTVIDKLVSRFKKDHPDADIEVATMGSLQAIEQARQGNADIMITYYPPEELRLLNDGVVTNRIEFMFSAYAIFGPPGDELGLLQESTIQGALKKIAANKAAFVTSSPSGGTYQRTVDLWTSIGIKPDWDWYEVTDTTPLGGLRVAAEQGAYTLADIGTYRLHQDELSKSLVPLFQGGYELKKPFSVMQINHARIGRNENPITAEFVDFMTSDTGQQLISKANQEIFNAPVFFPSAHFDPRLIANRATEELRRTTRNLDIISGFLFVTGGMLIVLFYAFYRARQSRQAQMEAEIAREVADQANQAKSIFLSKMSHELRTPMNAILGFSQLLFMQEQDAQKKDNLQDVIKAGEHLRYLIDDVLELSDIESNRINIKPGEVEIEGLIKDCLTLCGGEIENNQLDVVVKGDMQYKVYADPTRLKEVLLNLVSNAAKYNKYAGSITVEVNKIAAQDRLRISITDTGHGLSPEQQRHLFEPFQRLGAEASEIEGTGIGLMISKNLIELMDGVLGYESIQGQGSTFWVELALA